MRLGKLRAELARPQLGAGGHGEVPPVSFNPSGPVRLLRQRVVDAVGGGDPVPQCRLPAQHLGGRSVQPLAQAGRQVAVDGGPIKRVSELDGRLLPIDFA